jgi:hypothetical protein
MIFPLAAATFSVVLNGSILRSYNAPYVKAGRVMAPIEPFVTSVAASIEYDAGVLIVRRGDRFAQVRMPEPHPAHFQSTFVPIAQLLRTIGVSVSYDAAHRTLTIDAPRVPLSTPTPFNAAVPWVTPRVVFTPTPVQTAKPLVTGVPSPRRTPLPASTTVPQAQPSLCCRNHAPSRRAARVRSRESAATARHSHSPA